MVGHYRLLSGRFGRLDSRFRRLIALRSGVEASPGSRRRRWVGSRAKYRRRGKRKIFLLIFSQSVSKFKYLQYICSGEIGFET